jgi:hypothetical protein
VTPIDAEGEAGQEMNTTEIPAIKEILLPIAAIQEISEVSQA